MELESATLFHQPFDVARPLKNEPQLSCYPPWNGGGPYLQHRVANRGSPESGAEEWSCMTGEAFTEVTSDFKVLLDSAPDICLQYFLYRTCQLHTISECGKREAHINWSMVKAEKKAPVTGTTLRTTGPAPVDSRQ